MARGMQIEPLLAGLRDRSGNPLSSGKVYTYSCGSSRAKAAYTDIGLTTEAANPIILDAAGRAVAYGNGLYRLVVKDSDEQTLYDIDNVQVCFPNSSKFYAGTACSSGSAIRLSCKPGPRKYQEGDLFWFIADDFVFPNKGRLTLEVNDLGPKQVVATADEVGIFRGQIADNQICVVMFDGANMQLLNSESSGRTVQRITSGDGTGSMTISDIDVELVTKVSGNMCHWNIAGDVTLGGSGAAQFHLDWPLYDFPVRAFAPAASTNLIFRMISSATFYDQTGTTYAAGIAHLNPVTRDNFNSTFYQVATTNSAVQLNFRKCDASNFPTNTISVYAAGFFFLGVY